MCCMCLTNKLVATLRRGVSPRLCLVRQSKAPTWPLRRYVTAPYPRTIRRRNCRPDSSLITCIMSARRVAPADGKFAIICRPFGASYGDITQLVEYLLCKQKARGSSPRISTRNTIPRQAHAVGVSFFFHLHTRKDCLPCRTIAKIWNTSKQPEITCWKPPDCFKLCWTAKQNPSRRWLNKWA